MDEELQHFGGCLWRVSGKGQSYFELRAPQLNVTRKMPLGTDLRTALRQATTFEATLYRHEMTLAYRADMSLSQSHSRMGEAWQSPPGKEFVEAIGLDVDSLSPEQQSILTGHLDWLLPQDNWTIKGHNDALKRIKSSIECIEKLRSLLAELPPRPPHHHVEDGTEYTHQLAVQMNRSLVLLQRDYCFEMGQIEPLKHSPVLERRRLVRNATFAYLHWGNSDIAKDQLGFGIPEDAPGGIILGVANGEFTSAFGNFLETFVDCAGVHFEAYRFCPRSEGIQETISEFRSTLQAEFDAKVI